MKHTIIRNFDDEKKKKGNLILVSEGRNKGPN